jgi:hypothetical protein
MNSDKITLKINVSEDGFELISQSGDYLCTVNRDDDSITSAETVLKSIGFGVEIIDDCE